MKRDQRLLVRTLDGNRVDAGAAIGFENRFTVGAVGLGAVAIGFDAMRRQQEASMTTRHDARAPQNCSNCKRDRRLRSRILPARLATAISKTFLAKSTAIVTVDMGGLLSFEYSGVWRFQSTGSGGVHSTQWGWQASWRCVTLAAQF